MILVTIRDRIQPENFHRLWDTPMYNLCMLPSTKARVAGRGAIYIFFNSVVSATLLLSSSCAARPYTEPAGTNAASPSVRIVSPENYATFQTTVNTRNITVKVQVSNFKIVDKVGQPNVPGEGHIVYFLDVNPPTAPGRPAITAEGSFTRGTATSYTWTNLNDGPQKLSVELVNNDETPLSPPAIDRVQTYLQFDILAPSVRIISPKDAVTVPAGDVTVSVEIHDFVVVDRLDAPNLSGQGHLHYFIDVDPPIVWGKPAVTENGTWAESLGDSFTWHNVSPGTHTFAVELVTDDHLPLYPPSLRPAYDEVTVTVTAAG